MLNSKGLFIVKAKSKDSSSSLLLTSIIIMWTLSSVIQNSLLLTTFWRISLEKERRREKDSRRKEPWYWEGMQIIQWLGPLLQIKIKQNLSFLMNYRQLHSFQIQSICSKYKCPHFYFWIDSFNKPGYLTYQKIPLLKNF